MPTRRVSSLLPSRSARPIAAIALSLLVSWMAVAARAQAPSPLTTPTGARDLASEELLRAEQKGQICSGANVTGTGLRGDYFELPAGQGKLLLSRLDATLDFDPSLDWPAGKNPKPRSVRWSGWIKPPITGAYQFHLDWPGARIAVGREEVLGGKAKPGASITLSAGRFYAVTVEVEQTSAIHHPARLEWTGPHGLRFPMPKALLFPPTDTVSQWGAPASAASR